MPGCLNGGPAFSATRRNHTLCSAVSKPGRSPAEPSIDCTPAGYDYVLTTNLRSAYELMQAVYPMLNATGQSSIVFVSSASFLGMPAAGYITGQVRSINGGLMAWGYGMIRIYTAVKHTGKKCARLMLATGRPVFSALNSR